MFAAVIFAFEAAGELYGKGSLNLASTKCTCYSCAVFAVVRPCGTNTKFLSFGPPFFSSTLLEFPAVHSKTSLMADLVLMYYIIK